MRVRGCGSMRVRGCGGVIMNCHPCHRYTQQLCEECLSCSGSRGTQSASSYRNDCNNNTPEHPPRLATQERSPRHSDDLR